MEELNLTGTVINDQIEILEQIGEGGMGSVYRAFHRSWNQVMAVKAPHPSSFADQSDRERFLLEAQTWIDLGIHPNIVTCWFIFQHNNTPLLFLDLLEGGSLRDLAANGKILPGNWEDIVSVAIQVCDGLHYAHTLGLVHRDIKPANLLVDRSGRICVTDFGLVKTDSGQEFVVEAPSDPRNLVSHKNVSLTQSGAVVGTPQYASPEQWNQSTAITARADIYSLGIVLYELCCGRLPFDHGQAPDALARLYMSHVYERPRSIEYTQPTIPEELNTLILQCLEKEPNDRPSSARELRVQLAHVYHKITKKVYPELPEAVQQRADSLNNKAISLWHLGLPSRAMAAWNDALTFDAAHPETTYNRGSILWRQGKLDGHEFLVKLAELKKLSSKGSAFLGLFHLSRGDAFGAEIELVSAIKASEELRLESRLWLALGDCRMQLERYDAAAEAYSRALQINSNDTLTARRLTWAGAAEKSPDLGYYFPKVQAVWDQAVDSPIVSIWHSLRHDPQRRIVIHQQDKIQCFSLDENGPRWTLQCSASEQIVGSEKGRWVAVSHDIGQSLCDLDSGEVLLRLAVDEKLIAHHDDSDKVMVGNTDLQLLLLERNEAGAFLYRRGPVFSGHDKQVSEAVFSQCGRYLVSGSYDRTVKIWEVITGLPVATFGKHKNFVEAVAISPDSRYIASGCWDGAIWVHERVSGLAMQELRPSMAKGHKVSTIIALKFHQSKDPITGDLHTLLISWQGSPGNYVVHIWDLADGSPLKRLERFCEFTGANNLVSQFKRENEESSDPVNLIPLNVLGATRSFDVRGQFLACYEDRHGSHLAIGIRKNNQNSVTVWQSAEATRLQPQHLWLSRTGSQGDLKAVRQAFQVHIERAASLLEQYKYAESWAEVDRARALPGYQRAPEALKLVSRLLPNLHKVSISSIHELHSLSDPAAAAGQRDLMLDVAILSSHPPRLITPSQRLLRVWDAESGSCLQGLVGQSNRVKFLHHNPAVSWEDALSIPVVSISPNGGFVQCDLVDGKVTRQFRLIDAELKKFHWNAKLQRALVLTSSNELHLLDCRNDTPVSLAQHRHVEDLDVGEDWTHVAILGNKDASSAAPVLAGRLSMWNAAQNRLNWSTKTCASLPIDTQRFRITAIACAPRQPVVLVALQPLNPAEIEPGKILTLHTRDGHLAQQRNLETSHRDPVVKIAWTPDSTYFAACTQLGRILLWDLTNLTAPSWELSGPWGPVRSIRFDIDSRWFCSLGNDGLTRVWEIDWNLSGTEKTKNPKEMFQKPGLLKRLFGF